MSKRLPAQKGELSSVIGEATRLAFCITLLILYICGMKYTTEVLQEAVSKSNSYSEVIRTITGKQKVHGGVLDYVKGKIQQAGIGTSHFTGSAWCRGKTNPTGVAQTKEQFDRYLVKNGRPIITARLKKGLIKFGYREWKCEECDNLGIWRGRDLCLQVDHIDGNSTNNELTNLRILCPNCHSQTDTYTGKNNGRLPELVMAQS